MGRPQRSHSKDGVFKDSNSCTEQTQMGKSSLLIAAMAEKCRFIIQNSGEVDYGSSETLHPRYLLWMCDRIEQHVEDWAETKLHRWIGFIQCGMIANRMLNLAQAKVMFDEAKNAYGTSSEDQNLVDHLDPSSAFKMEPGGEG